MNFIKTILNKLLHDALWLSTTGLAIIALIFSQIAFSQISWSTILSLMTLLLLVTLWQQSQLIDYLAEVIISKAQTKRQLFLFLLLAAFFGSMVVTNDIAILSLLPLFFAIKRKISLSTPLTATLIAVYANLGSAVSPIGNPQNLYLITYYHWPLILFLQSALVLLLFGLVSLAIWPLLIPKTSIIDSTKPTLPLSKNRLILIALGSTIALIALLGLLPIWCGLAAVLVLALLLERQVFLAVDYGVVLTILNFFVLVAAITTIPAIQSFLTSATKTPVQTFLSAVISSQLLSNVPAAALLAPFTSWKVALYLGVSIGGFGTLIASLANLLAYRQVRLNDSALPFKSFFWVFTTINLIFLLSGSVLILFLL
ncbi:SLC13 family permease [Fructobacillus pseudoficulneus]|uniref:SLC13 family permease n=1 Tax=Fructobacillus pseudoficulneus TaxID=220714 RepID=UPI0007511550|nr:SLC13 family permease [Fructobacillus pseudoficulneus]SEH38518.1 Na+/H+ antiporter NhaD [Fructobacillus pseudoficulneus]